tara:strand:- start:32119 stop:32769 length:651 start_codon:yes stop_codon:yes gene_type:complete
MSRDKLTKLIEKSQARVTDEPRDYIGASSIGSDCLRQIWYQYKGVKAEAVPAKFRRTWAIGTILESLVVSWLTNAGVSVDKTDKTYHAVDMPYFQGHFDGILTYRKERAILEIKTAKDASFKIFVKSGLKVWNPQYYAQIQSYMGMSEIFSTYILVLNKDNSDLSDELVKFDPVFYEKLKEKAALVAMAIGAPPRVHGSPLWYQCKMCKFNKTCHK